MEGESALDMEKRRHWGCEGEASGPVHLISPRLRPSKLLSIYCMKSTREHFNAQIPLRNGDINSAHLNLKARLRSPEPSSLNPAPFIDDKTKAQRYPVDFFGDHIRDSDLRFLMASLGLSPPPRAASQSPTALMSVTTSLDAFSFNLSFS
ncbi:hypothetical protein H1C71_022930 [Ictidomys tridecemlineatus]|nr:hypothetical protein H1C71_022930 [Ictidomys tridecemlineatus]